MSGADEPIIIPVKTMVRMPGLENMQSASKAKIQTFSITGVEPNELYLEPGGPRKDVAVSGTQLNTNDFTISVYNVLSKESVNTIKTKITPTETPESRQVVIWAESQTPAGEYMMTFNAAGKTSRLPLKIRVVMKGIPKTKANSKIILNKKPIQ